MPTARDLRDSFDRVARQMDSDVPHLLQRTLRVGRRRILVRRTVSVVAVAAAIALAAVLVGPRFIRSSPTPADHPPTPIAPLMHNGALTYVDFSGVNTSGIFEIDPLTGSPKQIVMGPVTSFDWSPDGSALAYVAEADRWCELWVQNAPSGRSRRLTGCGYGVKRGEQQLDWSPDGRRIAFVHSDGSIHVINANGSGERSLTAPSTAASVSWSPDGTRIAFASDRDGNFEIYTINANGTGLARLTTDPNNDFAPAWSPDGKKVAFDRDIGGTNFDLYVVDADGSGETAIASDPAGDESPAWSPDGSLIAFFSDRAGTPGIYVMQPDGSGVKRITTATADGVLPAWSPDGTQMTFVSTRDGNEEIYVMKADGTGIARLTNDPADDGEPAWSK